MSDSPRNAVVTGATGGIGGATCDWFLQHGWTTHGVDLGVSDDSRVVSHRADVTDEEALRRVAAEIGPVDALVVAAGINMRPDDASAESLKRSAWDKTLEVNLTGAMLTVRAFHEHLRDDASLTVVSSVAALSAMPHADAYTASKGALTALTRSWAIDFSRWGIRVNAVCPGPTETAMMEGILEQYDTSQQLQLPQQRMASASEVAAVIGFLASPAASYVSGAVIPVDGGLTANAGGMPFPRRRSRLPRQ